MKTLIVASNNQNKLNEYKSFFNDYNILTPSNYIENFSVVEDGLTYAENSQKKAEQLYEEIKRKFFNVQFPIVGDDSGLSIDALNGSPGVLSRRFWTSDKSEGDDDFNNLQMIKTLKQFNKPWTCSYTTIITLILPNREIIYCGGTCTGQIIENPRGENGFAYDKYFELDCKKTIAELTLEEKNRISHRGQAAQLIKSILNRY